MVVSILLSVSRKLHSLLMRRRNTKKVLRLNTASSVMFISSNGKSVFKFLNP